MSKVTKITQLRDTFDELKTIGVITAFTIAKREPCFFDYSATAQGVEPTTGCFFSAANEDIGRMASRFAARIMFELGVDQ